MNYKIKKLLAALGIFFGLAFWPATVSAEGHGLGLGQKFGPFGSSPLPKSTSFIGRRAVLADATVTGISGSTLTVSKNGTSYSIDASSAKFRGKFWGALVFADIQVNDHISVWGTWTDDAKTSIKAALIRDLSIQRRHATFFGTILTVVSNTLTLSTAKRGTQTVSYTSGPIVTRDQKPIGFSDLKVGDRIRVRGLWDTVANTIWIDTSKVKNSQIKDFSLPPRPTASPTPTATP